ncbi:MAG: tetratricopeptide repeat protein [Polyangia bacterium]
MSDTAPPPAGPPSLRTPVQPPPQSTTSPSLEGRLHALLGQSGAPVLDELVGLLFRELREAHEPRDHAALSVRLALLLWDGYGRPEAALELLDGIDHPVATELRLHAALDSVRDGGSPEAMLRALSEQLRRDGDLAQRTEVGELLLWLGAYGQAATLLVDPEVRRLRALALQLDGREGEAAALLSGSEEIQDLIWAAQLLEEEAARRGRGVAATSPPTSAAVVPLLRRVRESRGGGATGTLLRARAIERLLAVGAPQEPVIALLREKLRLLGGIELLGRPGSPQSRVELLAAMTHLAAVLAQSGDGAEIGEAAALFSTVARFCGDHPAAASLLSLHVTMSSGARLHERSGQLAEAARLWAGLGARLAEVTQPPEVTESSEEAELNASLRSEELTARLWSAAYLLRAATLWSAVAQQAANAPDAASPASAAAVADEARAAALALYGRAAVIQAPDEVTSLGRAALLLHAGPGRRPEVVTVLRASAEAARSGSHEQAMLWTRAIRAAEALHVVLEPVALPSGEEERLALSTTVRQQRRRRERALLAYTYHQRALQAAAAEPESTPFECAAAYQSAAVVLGLTELTDPVVAPLTELGADAGQALQALQAAAERFSDAPGGILVAATRALVRQRTGDPTGHGQALQALLARVHSPATQTQLARQLGYHAAEQLGDLELAEHCFADVLSREPGDVVALHAMARLVQQRGETERAVHLLQQAVESALRLQPAGGQGTVSAAGAANTSTPSTLAMLAPRAGLGDSRAPVGAQAAALLCCELGALYEQMAGAGGGPAALERAVTSYEEALRRDPRCRPAARGLVALYRSLGRSNELLGAMARLLPLLRDDQQRLALLLEMGEGARLRASAAPSADAAEPSIEQAINAYTEALALDPGHPEAIAHLIALCQKVGRWALLAETLERAPRTLPVLRTLRRAYEELGQPADLARVCEEELALLSDRAEIVACARTLAELYQRLESPDDEVRTWERLYEVAPEELWHDEKVLLALERRYGKGGRHAEQAALIGRALSHLGAAPPDPERQAQRRGLLLRLGDVQRDFLGAPAEATATFEQVLADWPGDAGALRALVGLYAQQGRTDDLRRALTQLLSQNPEPPERSKLLFQLGELHDKQGQQDEAYRCYGQAFHLDPTNRAAFTAYERLCYRREQWAEALRLYEAALKLIETQKSRSYRPADLYLRRGQVQLQYLQQIDDAAQSYQRALESDAENDTTQATLERIFASRNQWQELLSVYERRAQLVRDDGKRVEILRRGARVATAKLRDINEAVRFYEKLHAVDPTDSEALDALEHHYDRTRDFEKLIGLLSTRVAIATDEQLLVSLNMRIALLCEEGLRDFERAITAYRHVVEHQPNHREALDAMARLFEASERWAELIEVTKRQIRLVTDRSQKALLYFKAGSVTEAKFGRDDEAIRFYEAAVRTSPACLPALHSLRDIYIRREDWDRVTQTLELESKLWTEDKERAGILAHIGQIHLDKLKAQERAVEYYEKALAVDKDCLPAHRALFQVYFDRGDWQRAFAASQAMLARAVREGEPAERSAFLVRRAQVAYRVGQLKIAVDSVLEALEKWAENPAALELLGTLCRNRRVKFDFPPLLRRLEKQFREAKLGRQLALVLVAQAALAEHAAEVEGAEALLAEADRLAPEEWSIIEARATLYERLRRFDEAQGVLRGFMARCDESASRDGLLASLVRAQLRLAELYSDALLDPESALETLRNVAAEEARSRGRGLVPGRVWRQARHRLAQELFLLGRYSDARGEMEALIDEASGQSASAAAEAVGPGAGQGQGTSAGAGKGATAAAAGAAPGSASDLAPPDELARYYDYLGRVLDAQGEVSAAQAAQQRAVELDGTYAPAVLALSRRALLAGNREQAELLLRDALAQLQQRRGRDVQAAERAEQQLRRGIARLLATIEPPKAVEAYRQLIELCTRQVTGTGALPRDEASSTPLVAWETLDDRVALAELLLKIGDSDTAHTELQQVLQRDLRHAQVYPLLAAVYDKQGQARRASRVRQLVTLLGYGAPGERPPLLRSQPLRAALSDELRQKHLLPPAVAASQLIELIAAASEGLLKLFPTPWPLPFDTVPLQQAADPGFQAALAEAQRLMGLEVEVLITPQLPGYVLSLESSSPTRRPVVVLDSGVLKRTDAERRFLLGRAIEPLRAGYATLLRLSDSQTSQALRLLAGLLRPPAEQDDKARELLQLLSRRAQQVVERVAAARPTLPLPELLLQLPLCADRAGLLCADDIAGSLRMMACLQGEELGTPPSVHSPAPPVPPVSPTNRAVPPPIPGLALAPPPGSDTLALGQVSGDAELARFFLSDGYHALTLALRDTSRL